MERFDILIVGAGPAGLAAACEAQNLGLSHIIIDRKGLVHSFVEYPQTLRFFSPPDEMAIDNVPFPMRGGDKPTREDALAYYRGVAAARNLNLATWESITSLESIQGGFSVTTRKEPNGETTTERFAHAVILATGVWDQPRTLSCTGADLPHVHYRFYEPTEYYGHSVLVAGGGNSAVTAALSLSEAGARVIFAMRRPPKAFQSHLRPFIVRDLEFAVAERKIDLHESVVVTRIEPGHAWLQRSDYDPDFPMPAGEPYKVPAHFVFALLGQTADSVFLKQIGLSVGADGRPISDPVTHETDIPGIYVAGSLQSQEVDIVIKGREQSKAVVRLIARRIQNRARDLTSA